MKLQTLLLYAVIQCNSVLVIAQAPGPVAASSQTAKPSARAAAGQATTDDQGERKFRENCSRCHNAPDELPRRITGTVVLHMRVRASLSAADERAILRYLAP